MYEKAGPIIRKKEAEKKRKADEDARKKHPGTIKYTSRDVVVYDKWDDEVKEKVRQMKKKLEIEESGEFGEFGKLFDELENIKYELMVKGVKSRAIKNTGEKLDINELKEINDAIDKLNKRQI